MRRPLVTTVTALALLAPAPAWAQESDTSTAGVQSPTPSPSPTCTPPYGSSSARVELASLPTRSLVAGDRVPVEVTFTGGLSSASVYLTGYSWETATRKGALPLAQDGGRVQHRDTHVRDVPEGETVRHVWTLAPTTNTRVGADVYFAMGNCGPQGHGSRSVGVLDVAPRLTLTAFRHGVRDYTFSGAASRHGQILSLYRVTASGSQVLTAQTQSDAGRWSLRRTFLGSGRFGFVVRTGRDMANAPGMSNVRPTVIH